MEKVTNPFIVKGVIPAPYFCDRVKETESLIRYLTNGNNVVLHAPRRVGKSKLIEHCFAQPSIKDNYYTIFVDILQTGNLQEFAYEFGKAVFDVTGSFGSKMMALFGQTVRSLKGEFGFGILTNQPKFSMALGQIENPQYTIDEIFAFLEKADKPCIVAIDEFQRIAEYPEKNVEAILRTMIQRMRNCSFIFSGSDRHLLGQMFLDYNRPFYQSAATLTLDKIDRTVYTDFALEHFAEFGKCISADAVDRVYTLFSGNTFAMHKTLNVAFSHTTAGEECTPDGIRSAIDEILEENDHDFRVHLMPMSLSQKEVLYAIGLSGEARQVTGSAFINRYKLGSSSSVQSAIRKLKSDGWVTESYDEDGKVYQLNDYFLMLWIQQKYGQGYNL